MSSYDDIQPVSSYGDRHGLSAYGDMRTMSSYDDMLGVSGAPNRDEEGDDAAHPHGS